jgi:hypothetical protein
VPFEWDIGCTCPQESPLRENYTPPSVVELKLFVSAPAPALTLKKFGSDFSLITNFAQLLN